MALFPPPRILKFLDARGLAKYLLDLLVIAATYFALGKLDLALAAIHPSAIPIAPGPGFALAAILLRGLRVWPAIFTAALAVHLSTAVSDMSPADAIALVSIATGDTLAAALAGYLISVWSGGCETFATPARVAKFVTVSLGPGATLGAAVTVGITCLVGSSCETLSLSGSRSGFAMPAASWSLRRQSFFGQSRTAELSITTERRSARNGGSRPRRFWRLACLVL